MSLNNSLLETFKELSKKVNVLIIPSPYRILNGCQWTDYETAAYYRNWLESGKDLDVYYEHQSKGFPVFLRMRR